jgi:hypothetical protein
MMPPCGYNPKANMSNDCFLWLKWVAESEGIDIRHAKNGGEVQVGPYFLDGLCESNRTIYEFCGCKYLN